jgi:hypothetical protein
MPEKTSEKEEIIEKLKLERSIIGDGGYGRSVHAPWRPTVYFRDSITCPNVGETQEVHPCSECFLMDFVHPAHAGLNLPCHFIPLNPQGDTIDSLRRNGDVEKLEAALLCWLNTTIRRAEEERSKNPEADGVVPS